MEHTLFLAFCALGYLVWMALLVRRLLDISRNPGKYDTIRGWERYRNSRWYEFGYVRYGKSYYASLCTGIPGELLFCGAYWLLGDWIQRYLLIPRGVQPLGCTGLMVGMLGAIFCAMGVTCYTSFVIDRPIFVATRRNSFNYGKHFSVAWKKAVWCVLVLSGLGLPVMVLGINASCYATEAAMVLRSPLSLEEQVIPYEAVVSAETGYSHDDRYRDFTLRYTLTFEDGTRQNLLEFGNDGTRYIHEQLRRHGIPTDHAELTPELYEVMKQNCKNSDLELLEMLFVVKEAA